MSADPCQKQLDEFRQATIEWTQAAEATREFVVLEPLYATEDIVPKSEDYYQRMKLAYDPEEAARKKYFQAVQAFLECRRQHYK